jgi:predicted aspartyl protease
MQLAALASGLSVLAFGGDRTLRPSNPPPREMPIKLYQEYLIVVDGRLGNLEHQNLLIDTGTNPSMIDRSVSAKLGLQGAARSLSLFNTKVASETVTLPEIQIGPVGRQGVPVTVADFSKIGIGLGTRIDAVIGLDVLGGSSFTVDYAKRRIYFGASVQPHTAPFTAGPQFIAVSLKAGGRQLRLLLDTGTPRLVLFQSHLRDVDYASTMIKGSGENVSGDVAYATIVLPRVSFGTQEVGPQRALVVVSRPDAESDMDGLLGVSCLRPKRISFDFQRQMLGWSD